MIKYLILLSSILLLSSCATLEIPNKGAIFVKGIPKGSEHTGWYRDFCTYNQPVNDENTRYGSTCPDRTILHCAFISKHKLYNVKNINNEYYAHLMYTGMTGGYLYRENKDYHYYLLQRAPKDLTDATGISHLQTPVIYDEKNMCISEFGTYPHADTRNCPDHEFHNGTYEKCIPIEEVLEHFRNG